MTLILAMLGHHKLVQYILRAGNKEGSSPEQDIQKAINVLHFELDRLYKKSETKTGGLVR